MAVFTNITQEQVEDFLSLYTCGTFLSFEGIAEGTQNSNFHVFTDQGRFVLTLCELDFSAGDIDFFLGFMNALNADGIASPQVQRRKDGALTGVIAGKTALLTSFLQGGCVVKTEIGIDHCQSLGQTVARMHRTGEAFQPTRRNREGLAFLKNLADKIRTKEEAADRLEPGFLTLIDREFEWLEKNIPLDLPHGALHADIFPDNVFFTGADVTGIIDFYYACTATLIYDLAIVVNAWCFDVQNVFCADRFVALMKAYESVRPLSDRERTAFHIFGRAAAMRFLMTRLHDWVFHDPKNLVTPRDPLEYLAKLKFHQGADVFQG
jgi:homoserine kinase type II